MPWTTQSGIQRVRPIMPATNPIRQPNPAPAVQKVAASAPVLTVQFQDKIQTAQKAANKATQANRPEDLPKKGLIFAGVLILSFVLIAAKLSRSD